MVNLFKIKTIFLKSIKWIAVAVIVALSILYYLKIQETKVQKQNVEALEGELKISRLKNGTLVTSASTLQYEKEQLEKYIEKQDKSYQLLADKFSKVKGSVKTITETVIDSIPVPYEVIVSEPFFRMGNVVTKEYSFGYTVDNSKFVLKDFTVPDSLSIITGTKRKWFLGKETHTADVINTNKYVKIKNVEHIEFKQPKKFYETTAFKLGVGFLGGYLIRSRK